ncbi:MAG TPA: hypothetical protein VKR31_13580 [Rhizomicrobium sp.]|nr:hypothetical protein [Rhizomicrobium sp.]
MAGKLPVERVIVDAYRFAFAGFLSVLGTLWLPYLILVLIALALIRLIAPDVPQMLRTGSLDLGAGVELLRLAVLVAICAFIVGAMVTVDLQNKAMGTKTGLRWVWFSLSGPVWRMAAASFLAAIVVGIVILLAGLVCVAIWSAAGSLGAAAGLVRVIAVAAAIAVTVYIVLRLMFFLPAVVVAEKSLGFERSWLLGGHNFWRILLVMIAVVFPVAIMTWLLSEALFGPLPGFHGFGAREGLQALLRSGAMQYGPKGYVMVVLEIIERVLLVGLINGAIASAYLGVTSVAEPAAPPAPAVQ